MSIAGTAPECRRNGPLVSPEYASGREDDYDDAPPREITNKHTSNRDNPTFRARIRQSTVGGIVGACILAVPMLLMRVEMPDAFWLLVLGFSAGFVLGRHYVCCDPKARHRSVNKTSDVRRATAGTFCSLD